MRDHQKKNSKTWERNQKLLFGVIGEDNNRENEFSYGWGLVKALETAIYVQNPEMIVEPYDQTKLQLAKILTSISNYDLDQMDLKSIGNLGLIDCFTCGYAAFVESVETKKEARKDNEKDVPVATEQNYEARRIDPKDIYFSPRGRLIDLSDMPYIAVAFYPTITELKENEDLYTDLPEDIEDFPEAYADRRPSSRDGAKSGETRAPNQEEKDPDFKTICVYEILDKVNQKVIYMTDHQDKILNGDGIDWPVKLKFGARTLYPITLMAFHPMPKGFYPKPELDLIASQLDKLNRVDMMIAQDTLTKWRKFVTVSEFITPDQAAKITDLSVENAIIEVDKENIRELAGGQGTQYPNLRELVVALEDPSPKRDLFVARDMWKQEITDIVGYGPPERGGMPKARTARESVAMKDKLDARLAKRSDAVADFYRGFGAKHLKWLQQTMVVERYARVIDAAKNLVEYRKYNENEIQGDFSFIVYAGTSAPRSTEAKKQSEIQLFQTLMPPAMKGMIPFEPLVLRLADAFQWKGVDALLRNYKQAGKQLAMVLMAMQKRASGDPNAQKVPPEALPNAAAAAVQAMFSPEEMQMIARELQGSQGGAGGENPPKQRGDPEPQKTGAVQ